MGLMTGVKGQSMSTSFLKTSTMLGRLEHGKGETQNLCLGQTV